MGADELALHFFLDGRPRMLERHAADRDRSQFGEIDSSIALDGELVSARLITVELHDQGISWADEVVCGYLDVRHRRKGAGDTLEQIVAERLQSLLIERRQAQERQSHEIDAEVRVRSQSLRVIRR